MRPFHPGVGGHALPAQQETQEVARRHRLDLGPQPFDGVAVNARQQPALAPFLGLRSGREAPAHGEAFGFERRQRGGGLGRRKPKRGGQGFRSDRTEPLEPAAQDFHQRLLARPFALGIGGRRRDRGRETGRRPQRLELGQAFRRDPERRVRRIEPRHPPVLRQLRQPVAPARSGMRFVGAEESEPGQRIVQLVGIGGLRPRLGSHPRDRLGIEPADVRRGLGREPAPAHHRLGPALLQRRIVEIGIGTRRQHLERQRRGFGQVAGDDFDITRLDAREQAFEAGKVHRLVEAVADGLAHQRMIRDLAIAREVLI